jgi:hypothetical protein
VNILKAAKRKTLIVSLIVFACLAFFISAYLNSLLDREEWNAPGVISTSTPIPALIPTEGWWKSVSSPTPAPGITPIP